jgi:hypothetical protein
MYLFLLLAVAGCEDKSTDPPETEQRNFLSLPANSAIGDTTKFDNYYMIHGSYGTTIQFTRQFTGGPFGQYSITATLAIDSGTIAVSDSLLCLLSVYVINTCVHIEPIEQFFAHPFKLSLKYTGVDLQGLDLSDLQFVYTNEDDVTLDVTYDSITLDYVTGTLEVVNAIIIYDPRHVPDSKYGWVRKAL